MSSAIDPIMDAKRFAHDTIENYIREYPHQQQAKMMTAWLSVHQKGTFSFTGLVDPSDDTVVTPQATVDYGYNWFSISEAPAVVVTPQYDKFFSVSIFDMRHNIPAVLVNPSKPILLLRPGQSMPDGDFHVVGLETDQGLVFTRMVVVDNMDEVRELRHSISMEGGNGDMCRNVQKFSAATEKSALTTITASIADINPDQAFGYRTGDVGEITLAAAVMQGQLGTPSDSVRYYMFFADDSGRPFDGTTTYLLTVPAGIVHDKGYYSITVYGVDDKLLIPNSKQVYDRTTYTSMQNSDGSYTVILSPTGDGENGIPTGKPFYALLRAYLPVKDADLTVKVTTA